MSHKHSKHNIGHSLYTIGAFLLLFAVTVLQPSNLVYAKAINADEIIDGTNAARERFDKPVLSVNTQLMSAAQAKAEDMVAKQYFAHYGPNGETPWEFFEQAGYTYEVAGENLAITNETESRVIQGWLDSPTHRENLLNDTYTSFGIGIAFFGDYEKHKNTTVIVAMYAKPKSALAVTGTEPTNPAGTVAIVQPNIFGNVDPRLVISAAVALIVAGLALELRHIRNKHHTHHQAL